MTIVEPTRHLIAALLILLTPCTAMSESVTRIIDDQRHELALTHQLKGQQMLQDRDYQAARDELQAAQTLIHQEEGVYSISQAPVVELLRQAHGGLGDYDTVTTLNQFDVYIHEKRYGRGAPETIPALLRQADWFMIRGAYFQSEDVYDRAISIVDEEGKGNRSELMPLLAMAHLGYVSGRCCDRELIEQYTSTLLSDDEMTPHDKARYLLAFADVFYLADYPNDAQTLIAQAEALPDSEPRLLGITQKHRMARIYQGMRDTISERWRDPEAYGPGELIGAPLPMCALAVNSFARGANIEAMSMDLVITVGVDGTPVAVSTTANNTPARLETLTRQLYQSARYRPAIRNGQAVTENLVVRHEFSATENYLAHGNLNVPKGIAVMHACHVVADRPRLATF